MGTAAATFDPMVEAAVLARYGVDPHTCGLRRLYVLLRALPAGYWPDPHHEASWSVEAHLLAGLIDATNNTAWTVAAANSKSRPKRPKPVRRPGDNSSGQRMTWGALATAMKGGAL